jgi:ABC-type glycerol-3-phosphate transport system permease component
MLGESRRLRRGLDESVRASGRRPNGWAILAYVLLTLGAVIMVFPFAWMLISSFKDAREVLSPAICRANGRSRTTSRC